MSKIALTYRKRSASSVSAGYQAALCGRQWNMKLRAIQQKRASHSHWHRHEADDVLAASSHHLQGKQHTLNKAAERFKSENVSIDLPVYFNKINMK